MKKLFIEAGKELTNSTPVLVDLRAHPDIRETMKLLGKDGLIEELPALIFFYDRSRTAKLFV